MKTAMALVVIMTSIVAAGIVQAAGENPNPGSGTTLAGVELPRTIEVEAQKLVLNGAALRKIAFIKIYVAGLYLESKENRPDAILDHDTPRTLMMHFLRDVDARRLCEGWDSSLALNTPDPSDELQAQFRTLCSWMEDAAEGERLRFVYTPAHGTTIEYRDSVKGPIEGKEFADALFRTWLGPRSIAGEEFKKQLLGE